MMTNVYIDSSTAAQLTGKAERTIRSNIQAGILPAECAEGGAGQGGISYRIPLTALPAEAQIRYWEERGQAAVHPHEEEFDLGAYAARVGEAGMRKLLERQQAVLQMMGYRAEGGKGLMEAVDRIAAEHGMSRMTLRRLEARYADAGLGGLVRSGRSDKGESRTMCMEAQRRIYELYLDANKLKGATILDMIASDARELGPDGCRDCPYNPESRAHAQLQASELAEHFPACDEAGHGIQPPKNRHAVNRAIAGINPADATYARYGRKAWEAQYMTKTVRAKPNMVNEGWFGDHHQFDVFVLDERGKPVRPWLTAWYDIGSGMLVGWCISLNPNSGTITEALARAIAKKPGSEVYGAPKWIYVDNGKDYRSKRFEGDEETEYWRRRDPEMMQDMFLRLTGASVMQTLRIQTVHAKAYHGWAKPVERFFRTLEERYCRQLRGYCGGRPGDRPENFDRALRHWAERGELMSMDEFVDVFQNEILPAYHNHPHAGYNGEAPAARYARLPKARSEIFSWSVLDELRMGEAERVVTTQGVKFRGRIYWAPELLHHTGEHVVIKFSDCEMDSITVRNGRDSSFICDAEIRGAMQFVGEDEERVARHVALQKRQEMDVRQRIVARGAKAPGKRASGNLYYEAVDESEKGTITHMEAERTAKRRSERKQASEDENWSVVDEFFLNRSV